METCAEGDINVGSSSDLMCGSGNRSNAEQPMPADGYPNQQQHHIGQFDSERSHPPDAAVEIERVHDCEQTTDGQLLPWHFVAA